MQTRHLRLQPAAVVAQRAKKFHFSQNRILVIVLLLLLGVSIALSSWFLPKLSKWSQRPHLPRRLTSKHHIFSPSPSPLVRPSNSTEWLRKYSELAHIICRPLVAGAALAQLTAATFTRRAGSAFWCYRDMELGNSSCDILRQSAGFNDAQKASAEETDFPLAFGLRVHTCATQVELLLRAIYAPHNFYCLHVDGRSPPEFVAAMRRFAECLPNVLMAPLDMDFVYKSVSQLEADLECMKMALASPVRWRYFFNLAGQELPLKTNRELVAMVRAYNGSSRIDMVAPSNFRRQRYVHWCRHPDTNRTVPCAEPLQRKSPAPRNVSLAKSSGYGAFSRVFVEYAASDEGLAGELYAWLSDTLAPEEHFYATLLAQPNSPGGGVAAGDVAARAVSWRGSGLPCHSGRYVRNVCILGSGDLSSIVQRCEPFANKFYFQSDPLAVHCLVQHLLDRRAAVAERKPNSSLHLSDCLNREETQKNVTIGRNIGHLKNAVYDANNTMPRQKEESALSLLNFNIELLMQHLNLYFGNADIANAHKDLPKNASRERNQ